MAVILTRHARDRMRRDGISKAWIERIVTQPEHTMPDPDDPALILAWRRIPELGGRFVRVLYYPNGTDLVIVMTFPDRGAPRRWRP